MHIFADTPESADAPDSIAETTQLGRASDVLTLTLAPAGGFAAWFEPLRR